MAERCCEGCGAPLRLYRSQARTCSARCRKRVSRRHALPDEMTSRNRWVRRTKAKRPITAAGKPASVTDPATWTTFADAKASSAGAGIGYVLGDGIGCWDLDHCIVDGVLAPWARQFITAIGFPLLIEVSQSGEGVHVFVKAPEGPGRKIRDGERCIEFYSAGRYIAVTGNKLTL